VYTVYAANGGRRGEIIEENSMLKRGNSSLIESALVLALMGILAGAIGGLAIGMVTGPKAPTGSTAAH
jgi:FlaG/FlaF family flagellin (archaellin)